METLEQVEGQIEAETPSEPVAKTTARSMFKYSEFVHIGEGAEECEVAQWLRQPAEERAGEMPTCEDDEHFHAWCRMPNPFQHQDIREKALASKARKIRELRDPDSDSSVILDQQLQDNADPVFVEALLDELLAREWADAYVEAQQEVDEQEEFKHIAQDREEFNRLNEAEESLPEEEQSDEYKRLSGHLRSYLEALREGVEGIQQPKRDELRNRPLDQLVAMVRAKRGEEEGDRAFIETYNAWMWFVGTFKVELHPTLHRPHIPMWEEIGAKNRGAPGTMYGEAPEIIDALKQTYNGLQLALQKGSGGN